MATTSPRATPVPACPIRDGEPCTLCVPGASGPADCGLVWLVMCDDEMREEWGRRRAAEKAARPAAPVPPTLPI